MKAGDAAPDREPQRARPVVEACPPLAEADCFFCARKPPLTRTDADFALTDADAMGIALYVVPCAAGNGFHLSAVASVDDPPF